MTPVTNTNRPTIKTRKGLTTPRRRLIAALHALAEDPTATMSERTRALMDLDELTKAERNETLAAYRRAYDVAGATRRVSL